MDEKYVITIEMHKDAFGNQCNKNRYAGIEPSSNYPYWMPSEHGAKVFSSVDDAKKWFNNSKQYLFGIYFKAFELDSSTVTIQKIVYEKIERLIV